MGSISRTERNGNVRYVARVSLAGKQTARSFTTERAAKAWIREREAAKSDLTGRPDRDPVRKGVECHMADAATSGAKATRKHLLENLGELEWKPLDTVRPEDVSRWRDTLVAGRPWADGKPLARTTVNTLMSILSTIFNEAVSKGHIPRNPVKGVRRVPGASITVEPHELITAAEVRAVAGAAEEPVRTMIRMMALTGLRPGEVCGLRVRSVDLDKGVVRITEQADGHYGEWGWKAPKTPQARRVVPLGQATIELLRSRVEDGTAGEPLFLTELGRMYSTPRLGALWRRAAKNAGVEGHSLKSLRHFYASALIEAGRSPVAVSELLGHSSPTITLEVYSHLWPGEHEATRAAVDALDLS
ncbi:site-specific integrase [Tsukamurella sputi]|uniref:Site-specific integrase n=1 Tax=Tsukamurella sputi TaxID=2591848 RepID=A0A5C5RFP3_9ACTN|nr:site-specific integrase [Tsukamurella sputi]TWS21807.1 site-specific integrase [Tsukamurella sputi]